MADKIFGEFWDFKPLTQAFNTLCGFAEPNDFATMSCMPNTSQTDLIGPPAIIPVPAGAVLKRTFPEPFLPFTSWCNVLPSFKGILIKFLLASSVAFLIASGTCLDLPWPIPTEPFWLPTTTKAAKPNLLPPLTTLVILFIATSFSFISLSIFLLSTILKF